MPKIEKFEELECWQLARQLARKVYKLTYRNRLSKDFQFKDQLRRAAISVVNNIAEGFSRFSGKEFRRYLEISSSSCSEVKSMVYLAFDLGYIEQSEGKEIMVLADKTQAKALALIRYLKARENGNKYRSEQSPIEAILINCMGCGS